MKNQRAKAYWRGNAARVLLLMGAGLLAGFCNGLLGAGGGIVLALSLGAMLPKDSESVRSVYSNALLVIVISNNASKVHLSDIPLLLVPRSCRVAISFILKWEYATVRSM